MSSNSDEHEIYVERFATNDFLIWKEQYSNTKALMVRGCRQVGKTRLVKHFANEQYKNVIYIDIRSDREAADCLAQVGDFDVSDKLAALCKQRDWSFTNDQRSVLVLDEVQENKEIYERIRTFNRNLNCDVIVTGSNLKLAQDYFQPAGDCYTVTIHPFSFEEILNFYGGYEYYQTHTIQEIIEDRFDWFFDLYNLYLIIGGYPEVFLEYLRKSRMGNADITALDSVYEEILNCFKNEFRVRASDVSDFDKIEVMFSAMCSLMCNEKKGNANNVEKLSKITEQVSSKRISTAECNNALSWLRASNIISYCDKLDLNTGKRYNSERFYFNDIGLFNYLCRKNCIAKSAINGLLAETFVFKEINENHFIDRFYNDRPAFAIMQQYELDFVVVSKYDECTYGIEVKSSDNAGKSIRSALDTDKIQYAVYARALKSFGNAEKSFTLPIFLIGKFGFNKGTKVERSIPKPMNFF